MATARTLLTVSYGSFNCTLEGFDDPVATMKEIAGFFCDLRAEGRLPVGESGGSDRHVLSALIEAAGRGHVQATQQPMHFSPPPPQAPSESAQNLFTAPLAQPAPAMTQTAPPPTAAPTPQPEASETATADAPTAPPPPKAPHTEATPTAPPQEKAQSAELPPEATPAAPPAEASPPLSAPEHADSADPTANKHEQAPLTAQEADIALDHTPADPLPAESTPQPSMPLVHDESATSAPITPEPSPSAEGQDHASDANEPKEPPAPEGANEAQPVAEPPPPSTPKQRRRAARIAATANAAAAAKKAHDQKVAAQAAAPEPQPEPEIADVRAFFEPTAAAQDEANAQPALSAEPSAMQEASEASEPRAPRVLHLRRAPSDDTEADQGDADIGEAGTRLLLTAEQRSGNASTLPPQAPPPETEMQRLMEQADAKLAARQAQSAQPLAPQPSPAKAAPVLVLASEQRIAPKAAPSEATRAPQLSFNDFAHRLNPQDILEYTEAACAWLQYSRGMDRFRIADVLAALHQINPDFSERPIEPALQAFLSLIRQERLVKVDEQHYRLADDAPIARRLHALRRA